MPMLVSAGSASTHATSPCGELALERLDVVELDDARGLGGRHRRADVALALDDVAAGVERRERLVDRAVVAPVEDEHLRPPGDRAGDPDREAVGVGGGQRELPRRAARSAAPSSSPTHSASSLGSISVMPRGACSAIGAQRRRRRVAGHRAGVAEAQVDVLDGRRRRGSARPRPRPRRPGSRPASGSSSASARRRAACASPAPPARASVGARRGSARARGPSDRRRGSWLAILP